MSIGSEFLASSEPGALCPKCLLANPPTAAFCADCGAPIGMVANIDPMQSIRAEGFAYRSAVEGPPRLIILIGMWLICGPMVLGAAGMLIVGTDFPETAVLTFLGVCSAIILYRTTANYIVKSRSAQS